jgi:carbon storage regulator
MLVLTRRVGEEIVIGDNIQVTILKMESNQVRIGITAPRSITVDRAEVSARRRSEAAQARRLERALKGVVPTVALS